ncbi:DUF3494 domain-containing protein [Marivirga sp. S37H4]|uniref:DUF3494 domain-containing protein n=1 Tax=Marivirga aurantiaca TaxID=2802615 RepID=A0A934X0M2_9BACT|nr:ice-binding family protein [Marivirga aurantiaca]MBK6266714.1 DUF3494 domain-containing protein [Marivirga aurantiaca]
MKTRIWMTTFAAVIMAAFIGGCKDENVEMTGICPEVVSTTPEDLETNVVRNEIVTVTFNGAINPESITPAAFGLSVTANTNGRDIAAQAVTGDMAYDASTFTLSFTPSNLLSPNTNYTGTIFSSIEDLMGNEMQADYTWSFTTNANISTGTGTEVIAVDLKSVERFGIIAGVGVSNEAGFSEIRNLDVGISPGLRSSITGFPPAIIVNGDMFASDDLAPAGVADMLTEAKLHLEEVYLFTEGASSPAPATVEGDQGGKTLAPGIYKSTSTLLIQSGDLTLDAKGDPNAVWIFQIASDFTTVGGAGGSIILTDGAQAKNIFWQVGSSATIGDFTIFKGNVLALTSITMNSGAVAEGRMLARNGSVTMTDTNIIEKP